MDTTPYHPTSGVPTNPGSASSAEQAACDAQPDGGSEAPRYAFTFGVYDQTTPWTDVRRLTWDELVPLLSVHVIGPKAGTCIVPAQFDGGKRTKLKAAQIDVVFLDSDSGATLEEIRTAITAQGWCAIISSTHSHLVTRTKVKRGGWDKYLLGTDDLEAAGAYLEEEKGFAPRVAAGARVVQDTADEVIFEHQPCPKFRIAIPLARPWLASSYETQAEANAAWKERIEALAAALRLDHDQSCTDTSRLFYLPRRPADGPEPETAVLDGVPCDIFTLPTAPKHAPPGSRRRQSEGRRQRPECEPRSGFTQPETGETVDLIAWARRYARRFELATALAARQPGIFAPRYGEDTKRHIRCVNEGEHTQSGAGAATFVANASQSPHGSFVYHCRHAHCTGVDRLQFLRQMLEQGWLTVSDLTDRAFLRDEPPADADGGEPQEIWLQIGSDAELAVRVAADLKRRFGTVVQDDGAFWRHNGQHWEAIPDEVLWRAVFIYDGALFATPNGDRSSVKLSKGRVESVLACMQPLLRERQFFASAPAGINCSSGFITFDEAGSPSLAPHNPDHRQRHVIVARWPVSFTPEEKKVSLLHRLLDGCFRDDEDKRAKIDLVAEVGGTAALGRATRLVQPKALVCVGKQAENGKSQVLALLRSLLPKAAVSAISPARFDDRTFACHLVGKLLNAPDELASTDAIASETFKQIITGDPMTVRDVYRSAFEFTPVAQHVYATNNLPTFKGGMDRGVRRRLMVLTFNRVIPKDERLERIGQRIGEEEADLLLDWAVRGAGRVIATGGFSSPPSSVEALQDWMYSSDPVLAWLESDEVEYPVNNMELHARVSDAHDKFLRWATDEGFGRERLPAVNGFSQRVEAAGKGVTKKRTKEGARFLGIACIGAGSAFHPGDAR